MLSRSLRIPTHPRGDPPVVVNIVRSSVPVLPHFPTWRKIWVLRCVKVRCVGVRCVRVRCVKVRCVGVRCVRVRYVRVRCVRMR